MSEVLQKPGMSPANACLSDVIMTAYHQYSQHQRNRSTAVSTPATRDPRKNHQARPTQTNKTPTTSEYLAVLYLMAFK